MTGNTHIHSYDKTGKCSCGHDHAHEHSHGDIHDRLHENLYGQPDEVPAVFSQTLQIELKEEVTGEEFKAHLVDWVESLKQWVSQNKYFIGHIKAFVESGEDYRLWLSTTGGEINVKDTSGGKTRKVKHCTVNITAIVFGADEQVLRTVTLNMLNKE